MFKLVVLGQGGVGKTSLVNRLVLGQYQEEFAAPTIGCRVHALEVELEPCVKFAVELWDTSGQEAYKPFLPLYVSGADCVLICFDLFLSESFAWAKAAAIEQFYRAGVDTRLVLVGLQGDKEGEGRVAGGPAFVLDKLDGRGMYCEVSAKTSQNTSEMLAQVGSMLYYKQRTGRPW